MLDYKEQYLLEHINITRKILIEFIENSKIKVNEVFKLGEIIDLSEEKIERIQKTSKKNEDTSEKNRSEKYNEESIKYFRGLRRSINNINKIIHDNYTLNSGYYIITRSDNEKNINNNTFRYGSVKRKTLSRLFKLLGKLYECHNLSFLIKRGISDTDSSKKIILFLGGSPYNKTEKGFLDANNMLKIDKEAHEIFLLSEGQEKYNLVIKLNLWEEKLIKTIEDVKPNNLHYSGHSNESQMFFSSQNDHIKAVGPYVYSNVFAKCNLNLDFFYGNSCYSIKYLRKIFPQNFDKLGSEEEIFDSSAISYAVKFYGWLFKGFTTRDSFNRCEEHFLHTKKSNNTYE